MENNRTREIFIVLLVLFVVASALREIEGLAVLLILGALVYLATRFGMNGGAGSWFASREDVEDSPITGERNASAEPVYKHALEAVARAGLNPDSVQVLPVDVGVMAFKGDQEAVVHRTWPVEDDVDYIQPFVQLRLPTKAIGRVKFEILDSSGETLFIHEDKHQLVRGRNLITPAARLPVHDAQALDGQWQIRVSADGVLIADHRFEWEEAPETAIRRHLGEDGEISSEMRAVLAENRLQTMSLEDLLADQEAEPQRQQQRK